MSTRRKLIEIGCIAIIIIIFICIFISFIEKRDQRIDECTKKGGILLDTVDGFKCVDVKELK